jgi:hypothetical protein
MIKCRFGRYAFVVLGVLISTSVASAQENRPAVEYQSLLNMRYYEADGGFLVDDLQLVFPPQGNQKLSFVITRKTGEEVARVPLRSEGIRTFDAFRVLRPDRVPGVIRLGQSGDFVMAVKVGDQAITTLPFSLKEEKSTDPYNPKKTYVREGPWRDMAYFSSPIDNPDTPMRFNFWMSLRELPPGVKRPLCTIHVTQDGQEIAAIRSPVVVTDFDWQFFKVELVQPKNPGVQWLTLPGLKKKDGELTIVVKVNGQAFKSYRAQIRGGQPVRLARNQMEVEPHTDFIATRFVDVSRTGGCEYCMLDLFWVSTKGRP